MSTPSTPHSESLRSQLDDLYTTLALGGSPLNSDAKNQLIREEADKEIDSLITAHSLQERIDELERLISWDNPDTLDKTTIKERIAALEAERKGL